MISDDERREVVQKLRKQLRYMREDDMYEKDLDALECGNRTYRNIACSVEDYGNFTKGNYANIVELLADLIDRPTTTRHGKFKTKYGRETPCCEVCGYSIGDMRWNHCPKCGAVIVDD